jgi:hypothetical protein
MVKRSRNLSAYLKMASIWCDAPCLSTNDKATIMEDVTKPRSSLFVTIPDNFRQLDSALSNFSQPKGLTILWRDVIIHHNSFLFIEITKGDAWYVKSRYSDG